MDTTECGYLLAVKDITIVWSGWVGLLRSAAVWGAVCVFQIEAKEGLTAVGTVGGQLALQVSATDPLVALPYLPDRAIKRTGFLEAT